MVDFIKTQNSFLNGEVSPEFFAHDNLSGLSKLENMDVLPGGGIVRRCGLSKLREFTKIAKLLPFSVSDDEQYIIALANERIWVIAPDGTLAQSIFSPWSYEDVANVQYAQRFGTIIFVHPDYQPRVLKKISNGFSLDLFEFSVNDNMTRNMPFMHFDDADGITITVTANSGGNNYANFMTNEDFWNEHCVGDRILLMGLQWRIDSFVDAKNVVAYTNSAYTLPQSPIKDWFEAAFGNRRGWPRSITFHQDRLVFGGSRDWPSGVWMSQVGKHNNFSVGTGLDDEAIFITLTSQQRQQICTVVSSDNLQILTSVGEWAISNKPLTPSSVDIKQHTSVGSVASRYLAPQKIEGQTVFVSRNMRDIRELSLDDLGENYNANDLCAMSKHLMNEPIDLAYNQSSRQLFVVMQDGSMAVLNQNAGLGISAWGKYITDGEFISVTVVDDKTFVVVKRNDLISLEVFDKDALSDGDYNFEFLAAGLPLRASGHNVSRLRIRKIVARVLNTKSLFINGKRITLPNDVYVDNAPGFNGDVSINLFGTSHDCINAPWTIQGNEQLPATILSVSLFGNYGI